MSASAKPSTKEIPIRIRPSQLPVLSTYRREVVAVASEPGATFEDFERLIARDQTLTLRVLKASNSALYGLRGEIDTLRRALMAMGIDQTRALCRAFAAGPTFDVEADGLADGPQLWGHATAVASWSRRIGLALNDPAPAHEHTAALLHDVGLVVLLACAPDLERTALRVARAEGVPLEQVERKLLETDHAAVGSAICEAWGLPGKVVETVRRHHEHGMAPLLRAAEHLATRFGHGPFEWCRPKPLDPWVLPALGIDADDLEDVAAQHHDVALEVGVLYS